MYFLSCLTPKKNMNNWYYEMFQFESICLIWSSEYVCMTPVGMSYIKQTQVYLTFLPFFLQSFPWPSVQWNVYLAFLKKEQILVFQRKYLTTGEKHNPFNRPVNQSLLSFLWVVGEWFVKLATAIITNQKINCPVLYPLTFVYILIVYIYTLSSIIPNLLL